MNLFSEEEKAKVLLSQDVLKEAVKAALNGGAPQYIGLTLEERLVCLLQNIQGRAYEYGILTIRGNIKELLRI